MKAKIRALKQHVCEVSVNPDFIHHKWFVKWHLKIVERLALELLQHYTEADKYLVEVMAWMHDYGKILDYDDQYNRTLSAAPIKLLELGFPDSFAKKAVNYIEIMDKKMEIDLNKAPIEVKIVSSADGLAHLVGPFMFLFWNFETDPYFKGKTLEQLMKEVQKKADKDWKYKIVLPEARAAFETRYKLLREQTGVLPEKFFGE